MTYVFHRSAIEQATPYSTGLAAIDSGEINWETDDIKAVLVTKEYWPLPEHRFYSDLTHEARGIGYPQGGLGVPWRLVQTREDGSRTLDCADVVSSVMTLIVRSVVFYKDTGDPSTSPLILCLRLDEDQKLVHGTFTLEVSSDGLLNLPAVEPADTEGGTPA